MNRDIKLTQMTKTSGCAAKIGPGTLAEVLGKLPKFHDDNLLVGFETSDDAAVYKITDDIAMIQTVDFFTPIVDDPYMFGQIAAANALSDVYAMGGEPVIALNIVGFPNCLDPSLLGDILRGGADKVKEAGASLVGGHTIQDDEPKYGLCVSGFVNPQKIYKNYGSTPGDVLILTKQIGNGIINTAIKAELASSQAIKEAETAMSSLNRKAKQAIDKYTIHACTDVTGFGLLGHCAEMATASNVAFDLHVKDIPYFHEAIAYAQMGLVPEGTYRNKQHSGTYVATNNVAEHYIDLLYDPQTSGGLLLSVPSQEADAVMESLDKADMDTSFTIIGEVKTKEANDKYIELSE